MTAKRETKLTWNIIRELDSGEASGNRKLLIIACPECAYEYKIRKTDYKRERECRRCRFVNQNRASFGKHRGVGDLTRSFYGYFRNNARRKKVEFTVSIEYLWELAVKQEMKCALSGLEIEFPVTTDLNGMPMYSLKEGDSEYVRSKVTYGMGLTAAASLDRIDSSKGYIEGNVQWTNKYINVMKNGFSQEEFIYYCHRVAELHANPELRQLKGNKKSKL